MMLAQPPPKTKWTVSDGAVSKQPGFKSNRAWESIDQGRIMNKRLFQVALSAIAVMLVLSPLARADSFNVFVGYADNLRASGFFPTPWVGAPGVVSQTPTSGITFDSGAVRIDNTGASSITITNFTVTLNPGSSPVTIAIWGSGTQLVIGAGQTGIFTQVTNAQNFDSSDSGLFGGTPPTALEPNNADHNGNTNLIGGCSSPASFMTSAQQTLCTANAPVISFDENGNPVSFTDSGHILDTGEWDFVNNNKFGEDGNESINWNTLGGTSRGGSATPEPASVLLLASGLLFISILGRRRLSKA